MPATKQLSNHDNNINAYTSKYHNAAKKDAKKKHLNHIAGALNTTMNALTHNMPNELEITTEDQDEIARAILKGCTSGILDSENEDGDPTRLSWELKTNKFLQ